MRLSSYSLEIANARNSCSERSANRFTPPLVPGSPDLARVPAKACPGSRSEGNARSPSKKRQTARTLRRGPLRLKRIAPGRTSVTVRQVERKKERRRPGGRGRRRTRRTREEEPAVGELCDQEIGAGSPVDKANGHKAAMRWSRGLATGSRPRSLGNEIFVIPM